MLTLLLKRYHVLHWGFEYNPKRGPFKNALFDTEENAIEWLAFNGRAFPVAPYTYQWCDCGACDHCLRNPTGAA